MRHGIQLEHTELLQDDRAGYATVIQKINDIIKCLKEEEKSSWCDPDFGPTEEDEYAPSQYTGKERHRNLSATISTQGQTT